MRRQWVMRVGGWLVLAVLSGCSGGREGALSLPEVPPEYAGHHMPEGWWTDPEVIEEGRRIYMGEAKAGVNCAECHGKDGQPVKRGARNFSSTERVSLFSDSYWFWRVSEGVRMTKMRAWKERLTEEERWKVIAFEHTFSHDGQPSTHDDYHPSGSRSAAATSSP